MEDLALDTRARLPDALRALFEEYPRHAWDAHPNFSGLVQFWLERHMMFRKLDEMLKDDSAAFLEKGMSAQEYSARLSRFGGMLVSQLHGHHQIEDQHYFPILQGLDPRLERGFEILDSDHHVLDEVLGAFTEGANAVLRSQEGIPLRDAAGRFRADVDNLGRLLHRHLEDEEEIVVPVILENGPAGLQ